jgi:hypothetical protein
VRGKFTSTSCTTGGNFGPPHDDVDTLNKHLVEITTESACNRQQIDYLVKFVNDDDSQLFNQNAS